MTETKRQGHVVRRRSRDEFLGVMSDDDTRLLVRDHATDAVFWVAAAEVEPLTDGPIITWWEGGEPQILHDLHLRELDTLPTIDGDDVHVGDTVTTNRTGRNPSVLLGDGRATVTSFYSNHGVIWVLVDQPGGGTTSIPLSQTQKQPTDGQVSVQ